MSVEQAAWGRWFKNLPEDERAYWTRAYVRVAGFDPEEVAEAILADPSQRDVWVERVLVGYERCVEEGLMETTSENGEPEYRLTPAGLLWLDLIEGRAVADGQYRGAGR